MSVLHSRSYQIYNCSSVWKISMTLLCLPLHIYTLSVLILKSSNLAKDMLCYFDVQNGRNMYILLKLNKQATDLKSILAGSPIKVSSWVHWVILKDDNTFLLMYKKLRKYFQQNRHCTYNITMRYIHITTFAMEKQYGLNILS